MPMQISGVTIQGGMNILPRAGAPSPSPTPGPAPGPSDPDFSNVVFMFDGDGTDGSANNTFTDSSTNGHAITENGDVIQGSFSPYGDNWSNYFGASDYLTVPDNSDFDFGTGDFTIEFWFNTLQTSPRQDPFSFYTGTTGIAVGLNYDNAQDVIVYNGNTLLINTSGSQWSTGVWNHLALARSGTTLKLFINGTEIASVTNSSNLTPTSDLYLGVAGNGTQPYTGYLSNVRVVKGTALYTSAFTPPTEPLNTVTNTVLLTCQSNRFTDNSTSNHTVSVTAGTPKVTQFSPFKDDDARDITTDGGSGYFEDANDEHLSIAHQPEFLISGQQFTIEFWFYPFRSGVDDHVASYSNGTRDGNLNWLFRQINNDSFRFVVIEPGQVVRFIDSTSEVIPNTWNHVVATGDGSSFIKMWLNGNYEGSTSTNGTNQNNTSSAYIKIAKWQSANYKGYISDFRYVVGSQVYTGTSDITLPTAPLTAITNTELLLDFQDSAIYDYSGLNNIDTVGNAQIDTAIKKYGTGSVKFDGGTGDYLSIQPSPNLDLGTGDFTIEGWFYKTATTSIQTLASSGSYYTTGANGNWILRISSATQIAFASYDGQSNEEYVEFSAATSLNTWHHFALVREGTGTNQTKFYLDGTLAGSMTVSKSLTDGGVNGIYVGSDVAWTNVTFEGYLDDFRITKGIARYTANFTPPTAALPKF